MVSSQEPDVLEWCGRRGELTEATGKRGNRYLMEPIQILPFPGFVPAHLIWVRVGSK